MSSPEDTLSPEVLETSPGEGGPASGGAYHAHLDALLDRFDRHARKALQDCSEVSVHEVRVDYKLVRATLSPLKSPDPDDPVRAAARPLRKLFRTAGPLRECHIHRQLLAVHLEGKHLLIPEWIHALTAREILARRRFLALGPVWKSSMALHLSQVVRASSSEGASELLWRAHSLFAVAASQLADVQAEEDMTTVDLHHVRRISKDARYLLGLVGALEPGPDPDRERLDTSLRDVHRALGLWHDATVAFGDLGEFLKQRDALALRHPELYADYAEKLKMAAAQAREQFNGSWRTLLITLGVSA